MKWSWSSYGNRAPGTLHPREGEDISAQKPRVKGRYFRLLALAAVLVIIAAVWLLRDQLQALRPLSYPGVLLLSFLGSASIVVPLPGVASVCAGGAIANPLAIGLLAGAGETLGEMSGYLAGFSGRGVAQRHAFYPRFEAWMKRRGWLVLLALAIFPNPFFDLVGIAAGALRFPVPRFLGVVFLGKAIKSLGIAYGCAFGLERLLDL